jgi:hypothetical protein
MTPAQLASFANECVEQSAKLREAVYAGDWKSAYASADWVRDIARDIRHATKPKNRAAIAALTTGDE